MPIKVTNPAYQTLGNVAFTLHKIANINRTALFDAINRGEEIPTDGTSNIKIGSLLMSYFEFDGFVTYCLSKENEKSQIDGFDNLLTYDLKRRLKYLYSLKDLKSPWGQQPFQTILELKSIRDALVHPQLDVRQEQFAAEESLFDVIDGKVAELVSRYDEFYDSLNECQAIIGRECEIEMALPSAQST
ncbi:MAG: hypothetical protein ACQEVQ_02760 [Pseudomonadota bacterium]